MTIQVNILPLTYVKSWSGSCTVSYNWSVFLLALGHIKQVDLLLLLKTSYYVALPGLITHV